MNVDLKYIRDALIRQGVTECLLQRMQSENVQIKFSHSRIVNQSTTYHAVVSVFINYKKRIMYTTIPSLEQRDVDRFVKDILKLVKQSSPNAEFNGIAKGPFPTYPTIGRTFDRAARSFDLKQAFADVKRLCDRQSINRLDGVLEKEIITEEILSSQGIHATDSGTFLYGSFRVLQNSVDTGHSVCASRTVKGFTYIDCIKEAIKIATLKKGTSIQVPPGSYDLYFDPLPAANIIQDIGQAASIYSVESGFSFLTDQIDSRVGNSTFTLTDNPLIPNGYGSTPYDQEGVPTSETPLITKGIFKHYLFNTSFAQKYETTTTGNAGILSPEPHQLEVKKGNKTKQELIKTIKEGLYITNIWYTRFQNYMTGEFSTIPRDGAFYIKNGRITGRVHNIRIHTNLKEFMMNISGISDKQKMIVGWEVDIPTITPGLLVKKLAVSTTDDKE